MGLGQINFSSKREPSVVGFTILSAAPAGAHGIFLNPRGSWHSVSGATS